MTFSTSALDLRRLSQVTAATQGSSALTLHERPERTLSRAPSAPATGRESDRQSGAQSPASLVLLTVPHSTAVDSTAVDSPTPDGASIHGSDTSDAREPGATGDTVPVALREQAQGFAQALVEVVAGDRTLTQLVRWTTAEVYEQLHHRVHTLATCPLPAVYPSVPRRRRRARVATVHLSQPVDGVAEVAARVDHGARSTAVALRLERRAGARRICAGGVVSRVAEERWVCTAVTWI